MRPSSPRRRLLLKGGVAAGSLFLPAPWARVWAQSEGTVKLLRAPKLALVLGNSKYKEGPLRNPANDAKAIGDALKASGFDVTLKVDVNRAEMAAAVQAYVQALAAKKGVGLFYYAGHGLQLAWRNYMLPVDMEIDTLADIPKQGVEVNSLLEGLTKAGNPMNVIILDACRDNPFGSLKGVDQKGLSQMDAPNSTLLAYATSPGNVASDGEGSNGLYTENLLREIKVPEAKVEDVFKRVRLNVRVKSKGAQVPWESTSLEEDFWFIPPRPLAIIAEEEIERQRKQEQALREKRFAEEDAERRRRQEQALREARLAEEQAERQRQQELAALEQKRIAEEAERKNKLELAIKEAQRVAEEAERMRRQEEALREARLAEEEAARKLKQELELREKRRAEAEAERKRKEEQALRETRLAEEEAARKRKQELAAIEQQRIEEEQERRRRQSAGPAQVVRLTEAEKIRLLDEEAAIWDKARSSKDPLQLQSYLQRYPSGAFSELAQLELDRALARQGEKKIEIVNAAENPFTKGSAYANTDFKVGDSYTFREVDIFSKVEQRRFTRTITAITDEDVRFDDGQIFDRLGNIVRFADGRYLKGVQSVPLEYSVGRRWSSRYIVTLPDNTRVSAETESVIATREKVTVPAGTFDAFRLQGRTYSQSPKGQIELRSTTWRVPGEIRQSVARDEVRLFGSRTIFSQRIELIAYQQL
jgi:hypothetical protein